MTTLSPVFNAPRHPEPVEGARTWEYLVVPLQEAKGLGKADDPWAPDQLNGARGAWLGGRWPVAQVRRFHRLAGRLAQANAALSIDAGRGEGLLRKRPSPLLYSVVSQASARDDRDRSSTTTIG